MLTRIKAEIPDYDENLLDSFICSGIEYCINLSERVHSDMTCGLITLNEIECSLLNSPKNIFSESDNEDILYACKETGINLVISRYGKNIEVKLACRAERLKIY